jgi:hypothetical protein
MTEQINQQDEVTFNDKANADDALREKLIDALTPGYQVEFDPEEADQAGAFVEDALSEQDAAESCIDLVEVAAPALVPATNDDRR